MANFNQFEKPQKKDEMTSIIEMALRKLDGAADISDDKKEKVRKIMLSE